MNPAFSIVVFTTLAGAAQGLVVALAVAALARLPLAPRFMVGGLFLAELLLAAALAASFLHLGHKLRAWRAVLMWRTSWMSREVIALPAFMAVVGAWLAALVLGAGAPWQDGLALAAVALCVVLWVCTAMIYACLRFVQEWAHPLTVVNYTLIGLSSGLVLAAALAAMLGEAAFAERLAPVALLATLAAWATRVAALRRNDRLRPRSTLQSATGLQAARVVQRAMGMTAGSFNTREFFHRASRAALRRVRVGFQLLAFAVPCVLLAWAMAGGGTALWLAAVPLQLAGVLAERWFFFAQARHPQNLYYQVVS